jgi:uracil-DNA glycosylase
MTAPAALPAALARARHDIETCHRCPRLVSWRTQTAGPDGWARPVAGFGDPAAQVFLLGLATAATGGNRVGRAFTGNPSATFLVAGLHRTGFANQPRSEHLGDGLVLHGAWMASAVRCPPPGNRPTAGERDACGDHLRAEWRALPRLRVVVAMGGLAWTAALRCAGVRGAPRFAHGASTPLAGGMTLLGCYHPSPQNTRTGLLTPAMLDDCLLRAGALAAGPDDLERR